VAQWSCPLPQTPSQERTSRSAGPIAMLLTTQKIGTEGQMLNKIPC
jgi:hypothetical protein